MIKYISPTSSSIANNICFHLSRAIETGHKINFQWIPAHCGIQGNEAADRAAKNAHNINTKTAITFTKGDTLKLLRRTSRKRSEATCYKDAPQNSHLERIDPNLKFWMPRHISRASETLIHRLRLGVPFGQHFLHRIRQVTSPVCTTCDEIDDAEHVLINCRRYTDERDHLREQMSTIDNRPLSLTTLLGPWNTRRTQQTVIGYLVDYLEDTKLSENY
ncbi:uncharacterized protein LOC121833564 [Ixodes scapularis]|uniref:uncharacterized protein LOC121833564 n=1 Tax=Ixodes scapularis TaxID=6945 RepID=UPI001C38A430|nr:uncharacterized protein LOC121833564 [Ixodes scapularis]